MCGYFTTYVDVKMKCKMLSLVSSETVNVHQPAKNLRFLLFILFFHIMRFDLRCMNLDKRSIMWRSFWPLLSHQQHRVENAFVLYRHQWSTQRPVVNLNDDSSVMTDCWKAIKRNTKWFFFCLHLMSYARNHVMEKISDTSLWSTARNEISLSSLFGLLNEWLQ